MVASNDIERSKKFYDAVFQAVGGKPGEQDAKGRLRYAHNGGVLMVSKPIDGKPATHSNGGTIGLLMASPEQAAAWHKAGVANGGTSIEDPPGLRGQTYLAYIRDPDGNKLCALCRPAATWTSSLRRAARRGGPSVDVGRGVYKNNASAGTTGWISSGPSFRTFPTRPAFLVGSRTIVAARSPRAIFGHAFVTFSR
jgi:catechol 2,3-dioxygenase-like lactoylglutathione lyase family enzyme